MRSSLLVSFLSLSLLTTGCAIETVTTEIQVRDPSRAAIVRTDAKGSQRLPLPADGRITLVAPATSSITLGSPMTIAHWCTMLSREPRGEKLKYEVVQNPTCVDSPIEGSVGYALEANWSDVRIVEHHRPEREGAWSIIGLSTILYGALAATVFLAPHIRGGPAVRYGLGTGVAAIGGSFDLAMIPTLTASDSDVVIHDFAPETTTPVGVAISID
jgi:hypothetical protein